MSGLDTQQGMALGLTSQVRQWACSAHLTSLLPTRAHTPPGLLAAVRVTSQNANQTTLLPVQTCSAPVAVRTNPMAVTSGVQQAPAACRHSLRQPRGRVQPSSSEMGLTSFSHPCFLCLVHSPSLCVSDTFLRFNISSSDRTLLTHIVKLGTHCHSMSIMFLFSVFMML